MLLKFVINNFLSFRDKVTIDLEAKSIRELRNESVQNFYDYSVLKSLSIIGNNSSGKSNFLKAISFYSNFILNSQKDYTLHQKIPVQPFLLDSLFENKYTEMEAVFILNGIKYRYGFEVNKNHIRSEWLFRTEKRKEEPLFMRAEDEVRLDKKFKTTEKNKIDVLTSLIRPNSLFISILSNFSIDIGLQISDWLHKFILVTDENINELIDFTASIAKESDFRSRIIELLQDSNIGISSFYEEEVKKEKNIEDNLKGIYALWYSDEFKIKAHQVFIKRDKFTGNKKIDHELFDLRTQESSGTQKLFALAGAIHLALKENRLLIIDELDSSFGFEILNLIIRKFNSIENKNGAQLIFSSHNTTILDPKKSNSRRDQIIHIKKSTYGVSSAMSIYDKNSSIRHDSAIQKNYEQGTLFDFMDES